MSLRAELLRLSMKAWKLSRSKRRHTSMAKVRSRLRLIEPVVPRPPSGTRSTAIDVDGIKAIEILVPEARTDRHVLYFHGGGYAFGTESLVRDFTWRLGIATGGIVLYFDYRLAPEHPFPAAVEDAAKVFRWLAARMNPDRIAFIGDSPAAGSSWPHCTRCATRDLNCRARRLRFRPGPISLLRDNRYIPTPGPIR